jgi:hypothetical protein
MDEQEDKAAVDAQLKAKVALEALRDEAMIAELAAVRCPPTGRIPKRIANDRYGPMSCDRGSI